MPMIVYKKYVTEGGDVQIYISRDTNNFKNLFTT